MAFVYKLEHSDETPANPPTFHTAVPTWQAGDTIALGAPKPAGGRRQGRRR
jgi:hypothetical protein